jgi:transcription initiation factor TFIIB
MIGAGEDDIQTARLIKYHNRLNHRTQALQSGLREVRSLSSGLGLPSSTEEHASHHYRRALTEGLLQGRSQESIAGACVYAASRRYHQPVTLADIAAASPVDESAISGAYRVLLKELDIGLRPPEPSDFLAKIATSVGVGYRVERRAAGFLERATDEQKHIGQNPVGVAAAALYAGAQALGEPLTQAEIADAAGVSTVTLSRQWQTFRAYLE